MNTSERFARDVIFAFIATISTMLVGFLISILVGRVLGASDLGSYRIASVIYEIVLLLAALGIPPAVVKYSAEYKDRFEDLKSLVMSALVISMITAIVSIVILFIFADPFESVFATEGISALLKILAVSLPFALVGGVLVAVLNGVREMRLYAFSLILQSVSLLIITYILLIVANLALIGVISGILLSNIVYCLFLLIITRRYLSRTVENFKNRSKDAISFGSKIVAINALALISQQADIIVLGIFMTSFHVGIYTAALFVSRVLWLIPQAVQTISYPASSEYYSQNKESSLHFMLDKSMRVTALVQIPLSLGLIFYAKELLTLLYGAEFFVGEIPLYILVFGNLIYGVGAAAIGGTLAAIGRPDLAMKMSLIIVVTNIILNIVLIPIWGTSGAAIATTISMIIGVIINVVLLKKLIRFGLAYFWFTKAMLITISCVLLFFLLRDWVNVFVLGAIIGGIYLLLANFILMDQGDWKKILTMVRSFIRIR